MNYASIDGYLSLKSTSLSLKVMSSKPPSNVVGLRETLTFVMPLLLIEIAELLFILITLPSSVVILSFRLQ